MRKIGRFSVPISAGNRVNLSAREPEVYRVLFVAPKALLSEDAAVSMGLEVEVHEDGLARSDAWWTKLRATDVVVVGPDSPERQVAIALSVRGERPEVSIIALREDGEILERRLAFDAVLWASAPPSHLARRIRTTHAKRVNGIEIVSRAVSKHEERGVRSAATQSSETLPVEPTSGIRVGPFELDASSLTVRVDGAAVDLQPAQERALLYFLYHPGVPVAVSDLHRVALRTFYRQSSPNVRRLISGLRRNLGESATWIHTRRNAYLLAPPTPSSHRTFPRADDRKR